MTEDNLKKKTEILSLQLLRRKKEKINKNKKKNLQIIFAFSLILPIKIICCIYLGNIFRFWPLLTAPIPTHWNRPLPWIISWLNYLLLLLFANRLCSIKLPEWIHWNSHITYSFVQTFNTFLSQTEKFQAANIWETLLSQSGLS